ncbi:hypothetical protein KOR42_23660 [Thalassoglobus neptunius]|uniref:Uncharacterized protein n=1 Tax=Thalassoglobus neptunius TaxID=1938619 RepID=A0A5C5X8D5_9PLAN|nr:hypothetical protein [Thalassoglobus neptunius]TWT58979.1 hypothetical protein KOR42_23660 [Thalassoglobus neptunius]
MSVFFLMVLLASFAGLACGAVWFAIQPPRNAVESFWAIFVVVSCFVGLICALAGFAYLQVIPQSHHMEEAVGGSAVEGDEFGEVR